MYKLLKVSTGYENERQAISSMRYRGKKVRVFFFPKNESVLQNFHNRRNRPTAEYRKLLSNVLKQVGLAEDTKTRWSQKAGCPCGCSPGFILDHVVFNPDDFVDVYVNVEAVL